MIKEIKENIFDLSGVILYVSHFPLQSINTVLSSIALITSITVSAITIYKHFKTKK